MAEGNNGGLEKEQTGGRGSSPGRGEERIRAHAWEESGWDPREKGIVFGCLVVTQGCRACSCSWLVVAGRGNMAQMGAGAYYWRDWIRADAGEEKGEGNWRRRAILLPTDVEAEE